jgi:hypothetical protein
LAAIRFFAWLFTLRAADFLLLRLTICSPPAR